jgi:hypothetical protein
MLAITMEHAVTKPMVRFGLADCTKTRCVTVVMDDLTVLFKILALATTSKIERSKLP